MKKLTLKELRKLILHEVRSHSRKQKHVSLASLLFEEKEEGEGIPKFTVVALYGPPAAGKGAAKDFVKGKFGGNEQKSTIDDYISSLPSDSQDSAKKDIKDTIEAEEDAWMTGITTGRFPTAVFLDLHNKAQMDASKWDAAGAEYWHRNETDQGGPVTDLIDGKTYVKIMEENNGDVTSAAEQFSKFPETQSWFAQARGFSKAPPGMEDLEQYMGSEMVDGKERTLKIRNAAADDYIGKVEASIESMMGDAKKYGSLFLADQAGESTTNLERIGALGKLRDKGVRVIGVYIHQPKERTTIANLHRKSMDRGGRRVAQSEVDAIADAGPTIDIEKNEISPANRGKAIQAMWDNDFDGIYVYHPGKEFDYEQQAQGVTSGGDIGDVPIASSICEPFGDGMGMLDIEGCDDEKVHPGKRGKKVGAGSLRGLEAKLAKKAGVGDKDETGYLPAFEDLDSDDRKAVVDVLNSNYGFSGVTDKHLQSYLTLYAPGGANRSPGYGKKKDFGNNPYAKDLFKNMSADISIPIREPDEDTKKECILAKKGDELILERWQKLAGIIK
tara:strand:- start:384 stop:2054 length:1671 start_codon:yes stop_codon:yes gene_type:complete